MFNIADVPFTQVDQDEKHKYAADLADAANYQGFKGRGVWVCRHPVSCGMALRIPGCLQKVDSESETKDQVELYSGMCLFSTRAEY